MHTPANRILRVPGTRNLRDLGGYATLDGRSTRWRTVFRSDCLDQIDADGQTALIELGLRTIIDLRDNAEVIARPNVFINSTRVTYRRVPIWDEPLPATQEPDIADGYRREVDQRGQQLREVLEAVLTPGALPALIHCAAGKDRTGLVVALLLAVVGVPDATIADDYALSAECLGPAYLSESQAWIEGLGLDWTRWGHLFETPPERILKTLGHVTVQHGGIQRYLASNGFGLDRQALLREVLTEAGDRTSLASDQL